MPDITRRNFRQYDRDHRQAGIVVPCGPGPGYNRATLALTASRGYYTRFVPTRPMRIVSMSFVTTVLAGADDACDVGIFDSTLTTLLGSSGATSGKLNASTAVPQNIALQAPVILAAGTVYYAAFSVGTFGGTAAQLEVAGVSTSAAGVDMFGNTAGLKEIGIKGSAHPLSAPVTLSATFQMPIMALKET